MLKAHSVMGHAWQGNKCVPLEKVTSIYIGFSLKQRYPAEPRDAASEAQCGKSRCGLWSQRPETT